MYEYLVGSLLLGIIWFILYAKHKRLRKEMIFGSLLLLFFYVPLFLLAKLFDLFIDINYEFIPYYWNPDTLFDLGRITGGLSIEDVLFIFFIGGLAVICYEIVFRRKAVKIKGKPHFTALGLFAISTIFIGYFFNFNPIYNLIVSGFIGFLAMIAQRNDLAEHAVYGGLILTVFYFVFFLLFNTIFPNAVSKIWNIQNISGSMILGVPVEEILFALSFGLMWAPIYEYVRGYKL